MLLQFTILLYQQNNFIMKESGLILIMLVGSLLLCTNAWTQDSSAGDNVSLEISSFSLIETNSAPVSLSLTTSTAGAIVASTSNSDLFIKISSILPNGTNREITARVSSGSVPTGTNLTLVSAPCTTINSDGDLGTPAATPITLSAIDQDLVTGIGTCYTGTAYNDGYQMTFTWGPDNPATNYGLIESDTYNLIVVFTITAHDGN